MIRATKVRNVRTVAGLIHTWWMMRQIMACQHSILVEIDTTDRTAACRALLAARRSLRSACDIQRAEIRYARESGWAP